MDGSSSPDLSLSLGARLKLAWRVIADAAFARTLLSPPPPAPTAAPTPAPPAPAPTPAPTAASVPPPERRHAPALALLAALQREGRLIDFLQQDVTAFPDEDVAAAARVIHAGCQRVLRQSLELEPAVPDAEGATLTVPAGFDAQRVRLIGNVTGHPPYRGTVRHHGWVARTVNLPDLAASLDPRVLAPAEVELP